MQELVNIFSTSIVGINTDVFTAASGVFIVILILFGLSRLKSLLLDREEENDYENEVNKPL